MPTRGAVRRRPPVPQLEACRLVALYRHGSGPSTVQRSGSRLTERAAAPRRGRGLVAAARAPRGAQAARDPRRISGSLAVPCGRCVTGANSRWECGDMGARRLIEDCC